MKRIKKISALFCVLVFSFTIVTPVANAQGAISGQQFGAWIASALVSLNCIGQIVGGDFASGIEAFHQIQNNIGIPTIQEIVGEMPKPYDVYTYDDVAVSEALNTSTIKIRKGVTTIDGVEYDELWVSPEGAQRLKTNAFDFITKYNLLTNDTSTLMTGWGELAGVPIFKDGSNNVKSQIYIINPPGNYAMGEISINFYNEGKYHFYDWSLGGVPQQTRGQVTTGWPPNAMQVTGVLSGQQVSSKTFQAGKYDESWRSFIFQKALNAHSEYAPFQYQYVNGVIPATEAIPEDYGLSIKVPHEQLQNFYTEYPQYNVESGVINIQEDGVDIDELTRAIFDYIESMQDIKAEWTNGEEPEPPQPVDPIENIDENVSSINEYQQNMNQQVNHMHQDVEAMQQTQQQQQQTQQDIKETSESIDSTLKEVKDAIQPGEITPKKFDLRRLFPFCIPFDIHNMLKKFDAEPQAPHVQLPFVIESIGFSYMFDLDFSAFDGLASAMRTIELIVYCLGLAWATSKVIKW